MKTDFSKRFIPTRTCWFQTPIHYVSVGNCWEVENLIVDYGNQITVTAYLWISTWRR